jgi:hypothetical protein
MSLNTKLKPRLASSRFAKPAAHLIDLTLADTGDIEAESTYVGRIISARFINPTSTDKLMKIDVCVEVLDTEGKRIGVLNDYLHLSARALRRLKEFLLAAAIVDEESYKTFHPDAVALCRSLTGKMLGVVTRESLSMVQDDGLPVIEIASYIAAGDAVEQFEDEQVEGQD